MPIQYINEMLDLPELKIHQILSIECDEVQIEALPLGNKQCCPFCGSDQGRLFRSQTVEQALGSTAAHNARMQQAPASTVQRKPNEAVPAECERIYERVWEEGQELTRYKIFHFFARINRQFS